VQGVLLADNEEQLASLLREMGLYLVDAGPEKVKTPIYFGRAVSRRELINFAVHLSTSVGAGIPILQALEDIEKHTVSRRMREALDKIVDDLRGGSNLSDALAQHPHIFSEVHISMVKAGEAGGTLDQVLQRLVSFLEWQDALASEIKRASIYPAVVLVATLGLVGILLGFVFPRILPVIQNLKVPLPFVTRAVMAVAEFVRDDWYWLFLGGGLGVVGIRILKTTEPGKLVIDAVKLKIPVVGNLVEKICLSRFAHHLGVLLHTGVDITQSLAIVEKVVGNAVIAQAVNEARGMVIQGTALWRSLQDTGAFPPLVVRMVYVGETTGTVDRSMERVTEYYDREIPATIKKLFAVLEPVIIIMLAALVLTIALAVFIPLYEALGRVGKR
jgi:type IV pilus assembly protein PilC